MNLATSACFCFLKTLKKTNGNCKMCATLRLNGSLSFHGSSLIFVINVISVNSNDYVYVQTFMSVNNLANV